MPRARALVAAVPQRVWTAVAGLVLLASLGVTLVLAAGLATWQGAVGKSTGKGSARPPASVVSPPGSAVIVVPSPPARRPAPPAAPQPKPGSVAVPPVTAPVVASEPVPAPAVAPPAPPVAVPVTPSPVVSSPRLAHGPGHPATHEHGKHADRHGKHADHGKHRGWPKNKHGKQS